MYLINYLQLHFKQRLPNFAINKIQLYFKQYFVNMILYI